MDPKVAITVNSEVRIDACQSGRPQSLKNSRLFPMMVQGIPPKIPCRIITLKVGIRKKRSTVHNSSTIDLEPASASRSRGGSIMNFPTRPVTKKATTLARPMTIRQPAICKIQRFATLPATIVVQNMPIMKALCICPKTLPRLVSDVMSATRALHTGLRDAMKKPDIARRKIIGTKLGTKAKTITATASPRHPKVKIDRL
mmetsp:Transcript_1829/g.3252  ORF Transcript_1829/g.3252 Transcript_1829/m.3252 type:complete len:200 (-) Transcript_1829:374-973(-)